MASEWGPRALVSVHVDTFTRSMTPTPPTPAPQAVESAASVVLLDVEPGAGEFDRDILERIGHPVTVCNGPAVKSLCPLLGGEGCPKFEHAHGIVFALDLDRPQHRAILDRYRGVSRDDMPIRVVVTPEQAGRYAALLSRVQVWTHEPTVADLDGFAAQVEAVDRFERARP